MSSVDWDALKNAAKLAMKKAYAPYSKFPVGVAALVDDGRVISGCNVENASYGLTLCAECSLISELIMSGGGRLVAAVCVDKNGDLLSPCSKSNWRHRPHGESKSPFLSTHTAATNRPPPLIISSEISEHSAQRVNP